MADTTFIYGLVDPRTQELRYVGKADDVQARLKRHIWDSGDKRHVYYWIKNLARDGHAPDIFVIEEVPVSAWQEAERFWISYFRFVGANLTNCTDGGDGAVGLKLSNESRKRLSEIATGRKYSETTRAKVAAAQIGRKHTPETKAKMSANNAMRNRPDVRAKCSQAMKKACSQPEVKIRRSLAQKAAQNQPGVQDKIQKSRASKIGEIGAKISVALKGRSYRPETIERMRVAAKKRYQSGNNPIAQSNLARSKKKKQLRLPGLDD